MLSLLRIVQTHATCCLGVDAMNQFEAPKDELADGEVVPVELPPGLLVVNSIGTTLFAGRRRPDGTRVGTVIFVFLFIPLFPIAQYVVQDAPGGGYYFLGKFRRRRSFMALQTCVLGVLLLLIFELWRRGIIVH